MNSYASLLRPHPNPLTKGEGVVTRKLKLELSTPGRTPTMDCEEVIVSGNLAPAR
jgi:hypothetical protein